MGAENGVIDLDHGHPSGNVAAIVLGHDPDKTALISRNRLVTYAELEDLVARARGGLVSLGVVDGDRVAVVATNGIPFVVTYLAAMGLGAAVVPLNPTSPSIELGRQFDVVEPKVVVLDRTAAAAWRGIDDRHTAAVGHVVTVEPEALPGATAWDDLITADPITDVLAVEPDHLAVLMFTSGTAGSSRAAMLTHGNLLANQRQARSSIDTGLPDDVVYGVLPLYHIFGLNVMLGLALAAGATVVLVQRFDPDTALESIRSRGVTSIPGVPSMWTAFAHFTEAPADAFRTVRRATSGAAKLPPEIAVAMRDHYGLQVNEGYGLTEAAPIVTSSSTTHDPPAGSVGRVLDGIELRVVDEEGNDVLVGDAGEIWVRGDNVFAGYLDDPEATARVLTPDGWLRTGDIAIVDAHGWLYLVDRAKDLVIVSGFNVYPAEVEEVLASHPDVVEAGVIGVPHPHTGEAVKAFVVLRPDATIDEDGLIDFAHDHLARYKCPSKVIVVDELPRNAAGKLVRRQLDDPLLPT
ncbi:MAG: AMP-binding protein [Desertimonas sp.]